MLVKEQRNINMQELNLIRKLDVNDLPMLEEIK